MGDTLFGKPYGLTHEEMLKAHHVLTAIATAKKTPDQLDLEVKDRKPDIVPKVGDKVKIKSRKWYEKWKDSEGDVSFSGNGCCFVPNMADLCGRIFSVDFVIDFIDGNRYCLGFRDYYFVPEMFEEVYPQESSKAVKCAKAFESSGINASALEESVMATPAIPALNSIQGTGFSYDLGKLSRQGAGLEAWPDTSPRTNLPQSYFGRTSAVVHQDFLKDKEPELQTIKRHRFIKLENL